MHFEGNKGEKSLLKSGYPFFAFFLQTTVLSLLTFIILHHFFLIATSPSIILCTPVFMVASAYLGYKNLYAINIFGEHICVKYFIPRESGKEIDIKNEQIAGVYYKRYSGRGSYSKLVIFYVDENKKERKIAFPGVANEPTYVRVLKNFITNGIKVIIDPSWALKEFGL